MYLIIYDIFLSPTPCPVRFRMNCDDMFEWDETFVSAPTDSSPGQSRQ